MSTGVFSRVMAPVEFEAAKGGELATGRVIEVGEDRISIGEGTVRALELAARLAQGGEVCLVHAAHDFMDYATWMPPERIVEHNRDASLYATMVLSAIAKEHCTGVKLRYVIESGKALDVILDAAKNYPLEAIVLAASARSRVSRAFLGSTADKVIRRSPCPVMVVPSGTA